MKRSLTKISLILVFVALVLSCNAVKHVPDDKFLLTENTIIVDGEKISDLGVESQFVQRPNTTLPIIGIPVGLHIYNMADQEADSTYYKWLHKKPKREERLVRFLSKKQVDELGNTYVGFNEWLLKSGDAPVIIEKEKTEKSLQRVKSWYAKRGWFNTEAEYKIVSDSSKAKRAAITFNVTRHMPYIVDSLQERISSPVVDSIFQMTKSKAFVKKGKQYEASDFENERERINIQMRNSGLYYFDREYISFEGDTVNTGHKANMTYIIPDRKIEVGDSSYTEPFKVHKVNEVKIITDYTFANQGKKFSDSIEFKGYTLYSYEKMRYRPKAITDAISITPNKTFKDIDRTLTYNQISDLRIFKYPNLSYQEDPRDSTKTGLISTIFLTPRKKATLNASFDAYTSTIQQIGIGGSGSLLLRNIFRGAETLQITGSGSVGSSKDAADDESFFNISEFGVDAKLSFPRFLFPINTNKIIPKYMGPRTNISIGFNAQNNIGLDRQNLSAIFNYNWKPSKIRENSLDLVNVSYVRNLNTDNFFNVYRNSFDQVNEIARDIEAADPGIINPDFYTLDEDNDIVLNIPNGINSFLQTTTAPESPYTLSPDNSDILLSVIERGNRLTEDNLIFTTNFVWTRDTRDNIFDKNFSRFRWKIESAGNVLAGISNIAGLEKNEDGNFETGGVVFSQYGKVEAEFIKHWELAGQNVFAVRGFGGIAIPYGNSNSIPFTRSYFAGGANDNRGWRPYDLGPGSSGSIFDFNEANFKLAFNAEYRFTILGAFKGAFFVDAGNIWNALDNVEDEASRFSGLADLKEIAIASGLGIRYDFGFFVFRLDTGFKTHNPALPEGERWFKEYNFNNAVYNIGINYPF
ncbi:translocation and assembly module lipoprotein TamL [Patiriisocius marinistellae]|uniref:translocation and assembly module lipoprotein TamL n=1 Tax=Patiriisocius marinistellae TaxID=2494560 RepID=UPI00125D58D8|nr:BamA/TamA family outer membrane protein [Patiriisocius marinistellae]